MDVVQLLPPRGLDQSILTAVLVGLVVLLVLTECFGWVFVGLVVPGYLASIFVIFPEAGVALMVEAVLTFVLTRFFSDKLAATGAWSQFFGRERFFLIVLFSVLVRQHCELWLFPSGLRWIDATFGTTLQFEGGFFSIGLVLVPLVANAFWKLDVPRGLFQIGVPVLITYLVLTLLLLPYTNLSFSQLRLTYENVALDFLASPKAYMVLLSGALLASRFNLHYGWDYNGILVPALLALAWFNPFTVLTTVIVATALVFATKLVTGLPFIRTLNLEGPRKTIVVFSLGFSIEYVFAWAVGTRFPRLNVTELFGFGYLLPSLLAVKMLQKKVIGRVVLPSLLTSLLGFGVGSGVGWALEQLTPRDATRTAVGSPRAPQTTRLARSALGAMALAHVRVQLDVTRDVFSAAELDEYAELWIGIERWLAAQPPAGDPAPEPLSQAARRLGLQLRPLAEPIGGTPAFVLLEQEENLNLQRGWDTAVLVPGAPGPVLEVPHPFAEAPTAEAAAILCAKIRCRAVLVSGVDRGAGVAHAGRGTGPTPFAVAHARLAQAAASGTGASLVQLRTDVNVGAAVVLHVQGELPRGVKLPELWPGGVELRWARPPIAALGWGDPPPLAVLRASPAAMLGVIAEGKNEATTSLADVHVATWLHGALEDPRDAAGRRVAAHHAPPSPSELRFLEEVLVPAVLALPGSRDGAPRLAQLSLIDQLARTIDYRLLHLTDGAGPGLGAWVLTDATGAPRRSWGTLVVRAARGAPLVFEVPQPGEIGTWRLAVELWVRAEAQALLVAGDTPEAAGDGQEDDAATPLQAIHQAIHRDLASSPSGAVVQLRGLAAWRPIDVDVVVGLGYPVLTAEQVPPRIAALVDGSALGWVGNSRRYADGSLELIGLGGGESAQLLFSRRLGGPAVAVLWVGQSVRQSFTGPPGEGVHERLERAGLPVIAGSARTSLLAPPLDVGAADEELGTFAAFDALVEVARRFAHTENVHLARELMRGAAARRDLSIRAIWDAERATTFLFIEMRAGRHVKRALVRLDARARETTSAVVGAGAEAQARVDDHLFRRTGTILLIGHRPLATTP